MQRRRSLCRLILCALAVYGLVFAGEARPEGNKSSELFNKEVGDWTIYETPKNICVMSISVLYEEGKDKRIIGLYISLAENYESFQIHIRGGNAPERPDARQKPVYMKIGSFREEWKWVIAEHPPEQAIFVFLFDVQMLNNLAKDGTIQLMSKYSHFYFPFDPLHDQIDALINCSKRAFVR